LGVDDADSYATVHLGLERGKGPAWSLRASRRNRFVEMFKANSLRPETAMSDTEKSGDEGHSTGIVIKTKPRTRKPSLYKVLMLNDDYTPMEFVVHILERFFGKNRQEAEQIMLHVHRRGVGICGVFTYEVAETKVTQVMDFARQHQHPLQCTLEKE
jgi:ATP-dependent Clp protease adaptor protein ClpS